MTPAELRILIAKADIYKMSLGKNAKYRSEALDKNVLVYGSEKNFYEAVIAGDKNEIARRGPLIRGDDYPSGGATANTYSIWRGSIVAFRLLPENTLIVNWDAATDHLYWGLTASAPASKREETNDYGQPTLVFNRPLVDGWHKSSIDGVPLSNLHPKARDFAINRATLSRVQTDAEYFRNLILDQDNQALEQHPDWQKKAKESGWHPKNRVAFDTARQKSNSDPLVLETADYFQDEIRRMAATAMQTVAYANGQTVTAIVKAKDTDFTRSQLENEIGALLVDQNNCCALTNYRFKPNAVNPHLRPSLDRKDSSRGYVSGNLQVVTRSANFFKSASDEKDWVLKADAMERMAIAMQQRRKIIKTS